VRGRVAPGRSGTIRVARAYNQSARFRPCWRDVFDCDWLRPRRTAFDSRRVPTVIALTHPRRRRLDRRDR